MQKYNLKSLRDAINDSRDAEDKKLLEELWLELHEKLKEEQFLDDENWVEFV